MKEVVTDYLEQAKVGRKQSYRNLTVFPLLSSYNADIDYILLDDALSKVPEEYHEGMVGNRHLNREIMAAWEEHGA